MINRRKFIQALSIAAIGSAAFNSTGTAFGQRIEPADSAAIPEAAASDPVLKFKGEDFVPFIGTEFEVRNENSRRAARLVLIEVKEYRPKSNRAENLRGDCFSLLFSGRRPAGGGATRFEFSHFSLGDFTLTVNPVTAEKNIYEAVINHLRP